MSAGPWELFGNATATITTIGANLTVIVGGIWAGREALKKLSALVRINAAQVTIAEEARDTPDLSDLTAWREQRARVIFTAALEEAERQGLKSVARSEYDAMNDRDKDRVRRFLQAHVAALAMVLRETTEQNRAHWIDVIYAEFAKYDVPALSGLIKRTGDLAAALRGSV